MHPEALDWRQIDLLHLMRTDEGLSGFSASACILS
jgi:hypothetical protein